jgi:23S rRNA (cytosine1962-C5)-methyltransferase
VLDVYSYVGSFGLAAARGGAREVICIDSSPVATAQAAVLAKHHGFEDRMSFVRDDVRKALPRLAQEAQRFDLVVLDPPKLAPTSRHLERALGAYRRANALALRLLAPDGVLVTCSCSAALGVEELERVVALAARDADRDATIFARGDQAADHPVPAAFPQGRYLKALFVHAR